MSNKAINQSRRGFLEFLGKSGICAPALKGSSLLAGLLANRYAMANQSMKRVVFVFVPMGAPNGKWLPKDGSLNEASQSYEGLQPLCHFHETYVINGGTGLIRKSLGELRWTVDWTGNTIDQQIATIFGIATPIPSLHLGVQTYSSQGAHESISRRFGHHIVTIDSPQVAYEQLFNFSSNSNPAKFAQLTSKTHTLDAHLQALNCARNQLSAEETNTLEAYGETLNTFRARTHSVELNPQACDQPAWNQQGYSTDGPTNDDRGHFAEQAKLQAEIITHAFACGLTRVATLQMGDSGGNFYLPGAEFPGTYHQAFHTQPHNAIEAVNYSGRCVAYLIKQLRDTDDPAVPGTKLIDNTVLVQVTEDGDATNHVPEYGPNLIATKMPAFTTGVAIPQKRADTNLGVLQAVAIGLGLESYIGEESHHCIWPCGDITGGVYEDLLS